MHGLIKGRQRGSPTSCGSNITLALFLIKTWAKLCNMFVACPPASRGHTEAWESITPTQGVTPKYGSLSPQLSSGTCACGQLGTFGAHQLLRLVLLTANYWLEAPLGQGGGGVVGVIGPAKLPPPCLSLSLSLSTNRTHPPTHAALLEGSQRRVYGRKDRGAL